jgi:hypothetical protein
MPPFLLLGRRAPERTCGACTLPARRVAVEVSSVSSAACAGHSSGNRHSFAEKRRDGSWILDDGAARRAPRNARP